MPAVREAAASPHATHQLQSVTAVWICANLFGVEVKSCNLQGALDSVSFSVVFCLRLFQPITVPSESAERIPLLNPLAQLSESTFKGGKFASLNNRCGRVRVFLRDAPACIWLAAAAESTALNIASDAASNRPCSAQDMSFCRPSSISKA